MSDATGQDRQARFRQRWIESGQYKRVVTLLPMGVAKDLARMAKTAGVSQAHIITLLVAGQLHRDGKRWTDIDGKRHDTAPPKP